MTTEEKSFTAYTETLEEKEAWLKDFDVLVKGKKKKKMIE